MKEKISEESKRIEVIQKLVKESIEHIDTEIAFDYNLLTLQETTDELKLLCCKIVVALSELKKWLTEDGFFMQFKYYNPKTDLVIYEIPLEDVEVLANDTNKLVSWVISIAKIDCAHVGNYLNEKAIITDCISALDRLAYKKYTNNLN